MTENAYLACAIIVTVFAGLFFLAVIFLRNRILLAVSVIKIASK